MIDSTIFRQCGIDKRTRVRIDYRHLKYHIMFTVPGHGTLHWYTTDKTESIEIGLELIEMTFYESRDFFERVRKIDYFKKLSVLV